MNKNIAIFIFALVAVVVIIILSLLYSEWNTEPERIELKERPIKTESVKSKPEPIKTTEPKINPPLIEKTPDKIDTPIVEGIKARSAIISQKDELYTDELVLDRDKVISADPIPARPKQPFIKWVLNFSGSVAGAILAKDNKLYFGTYDFQVFILDASTGNLISQTKTISQPINSTRLYKDMFLVPQRNGQVTAFSIIDGKEKWNHRSAVDKSKAEIDFSISGIAVYGSKFYVSKHWGNLYIVNADTGVMNQDVGVSYESRINLPAIKTEGGVLFSNVAGELHCFKDDGTENWHYTIPKGYPLSTHLVGNTLFIATTEKELIALNLKDRSIIWTKELAGFGYDSMTFINNVLFIQAKNIYAFEPAQGKILWQIQSTSDEGFCRGASIITNDNIYAIEQSGRLVCAGLNDGAVTKEFNLKEIIRSPITFDGELLYIPTTQKKIYAVDVKGLK